MTLRGCAVTVLVLLSLQLASAAEGQTPVPPTVTIFLRDGMEVSGILEGQDDSSYLLRTPLGRLSIDRDRVRRLIEVPSGGFTADSGDTTDLRDQVVVYLKEGKIVDGVLVAKGRGVIVLISADGRLTIPKTNIDRIEYVGLPNSEKGERVRVELVNGRTYEGSLQQETGATLSLDTSFGVIEIDKMQLLSLRYLGTPAYRPGKDGPGAPVSPRKNQSNSREETWALGYSSGFGADYHGGYTLGYTRWVPVRSNQAMTIHGAGGMELTYFGVNKDLKKEEVPGGVDVSGRAVLWSLNAAAPLTFHPVDGGLYRFHIVPSIAGTLVSRRFELAYPSFPANSVKESSTGLRFGAGLDFLFDFAIGENHSVGFGFRQRYLTGGESSHGDFVLYLARLRGFFVLPWS